VWNILNNYHKNTFIKITVGNNVLRYRKHKLIKILYTYIQLQVSAVADEPHSWLPQLHRAVHSDKHSENSQSPEFGTKFHREVALLLEISKFPYKSYNTV